MALITVKIPEGGIDVLGMLYEGGREVAVAPARAKILIEEGAELVHDVLGELTGQNTRPDSVENSGAMTTADLRGGDPAGAAEADPADADAVASDDEPQADEPQAEDSPESENEPQAVEDEEPQAEQPSGEPTGEQPAGEDGTVTE